MIFGGAYAPIRVELGGSHPKKDLFPPEILLRAFGILRISHSVFELGVRNFAITEPQKKPHTRPSTGLTFDPSDPSVVWVHRTRDSSSVRSHNFSSIYNRLGAMVRKPPNRPENKRNIVALRDYKYLALILM